jgi:hypothetical protein
LTSSDSRSSIRASRAASRAATWRSRAEEAGGFDSRKPQKASRPIAQAVVGEVALAPAVRRPSFSRASSPISWPARMIVWTSSPPPRTGETIATSPAVRTSTWSAGSPWRIRKLPTG